jgi:serine/threonine protein kinase
MLTHLRRADIKPTNVFLTAAGDVKLGDLGLGRALSSRSAQADSLVGTPFYMSPEVIENQAYSYASDIWQLGCTIYEIAMLRSPFCVADGGATDATAGVAGSGQSAATASPAAATAGGNANLFAVAQRILACDFPPLSDIYTAPLRQLVHSMLQRDPAARPTAAQIEETLRAHLSQGLANYEDLGVIGRGALRVFCRRIERTCGFDKGERIHQKRSHSGGLTSTSVVSVLNFCFCFLLILSTRSCSFRQPLGGAPVSMSPHRSRGRRQKGADLRNGHGGAARVRERGETAADGARSCAFFVLRVAFAHPSIG